MNGMKDDRLGWNLASTGQIEDEVIDCIIYFFLACKDNIRG